jgi:prophage regulatory protein
MSKTTDRFLREPEVAAMTSLSRAERFKREARSEFPRRVKLGERAVGWSLLEVEEWMRTRPRARHAPRRKAELEANPEGGDPRSFETDRTKRSGDRRSCSSRVTSVAPRPNDAE